MAPRVRREAQKAIQLQLENPRIEAGEIRHEALQQGGSPQWLKGQEREKT